MNFRIQQIDDGKGSMVFALSGRIQAEHTETLRELLGKEVRKVTLDLKEVTLVDRDVVRFFGGCEADGVELKNCPAYVREWIRQERARAGAKPDGPGSNET